MKNIGQKLVTWMDSKWENKPKPIWAPIYFWIRRKLRKIFGTQ